MAKKTWRDSPAAHRFYHSKAWDNVRNLVLDRAHGLCEDCTERGEYRPADVVHHTTPLDEDNVNDPGVSLNPEKLRALCHDCHALAHKRLGVGMLGRSTEEPRVGFDSNGNIVKL